MSAEWLWLWQRCAVRCQRRLLGGRISRALSGRALALAALRGVGAGGGGKMPAYETTIMISTLTSRKRTIDLLKGVINLVLEKKGVVMDVNSLGTRALAYDIKKHKQTHSAQTTRS